MQMASSRWLGRFWKGQQCQTRAGVLGGPAALAEPSVVRGPPSPASRFCRAAPAPGQLFGPVLVFLLFEVNMTFSERGTLHYDKLELILLKSGLS